MNGLPRRTGKPIDLERLARTPEWRRGIALAQRSLADALRDGRHPRRDCPACGATGARPFVDVFGWSYVECVGCAHVFCSAPPGERVIERLYAEAGESGAAQHGVYLDEMLFRSRVDQVARPKVEWISEAVGGGGSWVDIGCGTGEVLAAAGAAGWDARGFDVDPDEVEFARARGLAVEPLFVDAANVAACLEGADLVSAFNLLEHIVEPAALLRTLRSGVDAGAHLAVEVPRHPSLSSFCIRAFPELAARHIYPPDHLHAFSEASLARLLGDAGFEPCAIWTFGQDFYELISCAAVAADTPYDDLHRRVLDLFPPIQQLVDERGLGDVMLVIARAKES